MSNQHLDPSSDIFSDDSAIQSTPSYYTLLGKRKRTNNDQLASLTLADHSYLSFQVPGERDKARRHRFYFDCIATVEQPDTFDYIDYNALVFSKNILFALDLSM
ncbi:hypothetical protein H4219_000780 [Mycoemilia scoparia]|uniref:Uncharacterized protein n=1 Tax=Mycoemilia scoparia TaxID=417184 RepID=A0A9W8DWV2_9FUNG|nr:hypothetical protein H4219_000780 [Mycoemilia scoparia]